MKQTVIISAFICCGKTYMTEKYNGWKYTMLDIETGDFTGTSNISENMTQKINPDFPQNYIECIKENIGKYDIIFVSAHSKVRRALKDNNLKFILVTPRRNMKHVWLDRLRQLETPDTIIQSIANNWDSYINMMELEKDKHCIVNWLNKNHLYIDDVYLDFVFRTYMPEWSVSVNE